MNISLFSLFYYYLADNHLSEFSEGTNTFQATLNNDPGYQVSVADLEAMHTVPLDQISELVKQVHYPNLLTCNLLRDACACWLAFCQQSPTCRCYSASIHLSKALDEKERTTIFRNFWPNWKEVYIGLKEKTPSLFNSKTRLLAIFLLGMKINSIGKQPFYVASKSCHGLLYLFGPGTSVKIKLQLYA